MKKDVTIKDLKIFALVFSGIFAGLSLYNLLVRGNAKVAGILFSIATVMLLIGLLKPILARPIHFFMGKVLDSIIIILFAIVFYCVFAPIGVILRITKKDILGLRIDKEKDTYWINRKIKEIDPGSMERQY